MKDPFPITAGSYRAVDGQLIPDDAAAPPSATADAVSDALPVASDSNDSAGAKRRGRTTQE